MEFLHWFILQVYLVYSFVARSDLPSLHHVLSDATSCHVVHVLLRKCSVSHIQWNPHMFLSSEQWLQHPNRFMSDHTASMG